MYLLHIALHETKGEESDKLNVYYVPYYTIAFIRLRLETGDDCTSNIWMYCLYSTV